MAFPYSAQISIIIVPATKTLFNLLFCFTAPLLSYDSIRHPEVSSLKDAIQSECVTRWVSGVARL